MAQWRLLRSVYMLAARKVMGSDRTEHMNGRALMWAGPDSGLHVYCTYLWVGRGTPANHRHPRYSYTLRYHSTDSLLSCPTSPMNP